MHWVLGVVYPEGDSRARAGPAGANLAMIRKVAVSLTRRAPGKQSGVTKRLKAGWDDEFLVAQPPPGRCIHHRQRRAGPPSPWMTPWMNESAVSNGASSAIFAGLYRTPRAAGGR